MLFSRKLYIIHIQLMYCTHQPTAASHKSQLKHVVLYKKTIPLPNYMRPIQTVTGNSLWRSITLRVVPAGGLMSWTDMLLHGGLLQTADVVSWAARSTVVCYRRPVLSRGQQGRRRSATAGRPLPPRTSVSMWNLRLLFPGAMHWTETMISPRQWSTTLDVTKCNGVPPWM